MKLLQLLVRLRQQAGEVVQAHLAQQFMDELGPPERPVLLLQAVQRGEEEFRFAVFHLPRVAPGLAVAEVLEDGHAVVTIEDLVLARLVGVGPNQQERVSARPLDVGPSFACRSGGITLLLSGWGRSSSSGTIRGPRCVAPVPEPLATNPRFASAFWLIEPP